jgi:iron-sulfur cluster assembly protein
MLGFDKRKDSDQEFLIENLTVYIDKKHTLYLIGKEIDFLENEEARGFMFVDPEKEKSNE